MGIGNIFKGIGTKVDDLVTKGVQLEKKIGEKMQVDPITKAKMQIDDDLVKGRFDQRKKEFKAGLEDIPGEYKKVKNKIKNKTNKVANTMKDNAKSYAEEMAEDPARALIKEVKPNKEELAAGVMTSQTITQHLTGMQITAPVAAAFMLGGTALGLTGEYQEKISSAKLGTIEKIDKANMIGGSDSLEFQAAQESEDVARRAFDEGGSKLGVLAGVGAYRGESATGDLVFALHNQRNGYGGSE
jgi:hypothetical protein